jgi:uncharacterized heparinase superfamily protein
VLQLLRFVGRQTSLALADRVMTTPLLRWAWSGLADSGYVPGLAEFRPSDREAVRDMMAGRYLLAFKLVDTHGASPFSVEVDNPDWHNSLHGFGWLRHFRDVRDAASRGFARMLVLDWIATEGEYHPGTWTLSLTAQRVMNWLRQLDLLLEGASPEEHKTITRAIGTQIQSLRNRRRFARDPVDQLLATAALVAAELCSEAQETRIEERLRELNLLLARQIDGDGMHLSRNPRVQLVLLIELASLGRSLLNHKTESTLEFAAQVERMHEALDAVTLGSGEPAYFNGCGHVALDTLVAVQANAARKRHRTGAVGGYGILRDGEAVVVADSGLVPPLDHAHAAHDSALAFEFSHGTELIVGSCGPAPSNWTQNRDLFRQAMAHTGPAVDDRGAAVLNSRGPYAGRLTPRTDPEPIEVHQEDHLMLLRATGWQSSGMIVERRLTLLSEGTTLVGQDKVTRAGDKAPEGLVSLRFHLAPGVILRRTGDAMVRLVLPNGAKWNFLWEGGTVFEDDSVRQSAYFGFQRTRQIVIEAEARDGLELAWIFTRESA